MIATRGPAKILDSWWAKGLIGITLLACQALVAGSAAWFAATITQPFVKIDKALEVVQAAIEATKHEHETLRAADQSMRAEIDTVRASIANHDAVDLRIDSDHMARITQNATDIKELIKALSALKETVTAIDERQKNNTYRIEGLETSHGIRPQR